MTRRRRQTRGKVSMILPDIHFPDHHLPSLRTCLQAAKAVRPDEVVLTGDEINCSHWSRHPKWSISETARHSYLQHEIAPFRSYLRALRKYTGRIVWVFGNHDAWPERLLANEMGELAEDMASVITPSALLADDVDVMIPYVDHGIPRYEIAPNLWCVHGWSHSKHAAAAHLNLSKTVSIVHGHTHRIQSATERLPETDRYVTAWSPGCLCKFQPMWLHGKPTNWARGFSFIYHSRRDPLDWTETTHRIDVDGRAILDGGRSVGPEGKWGE